MTREDRVLDIIVPCLNHIDVTKECLAAIRKYPPLEDYRVTVVDDGSDDSTQEELSQDNFGFPQYQYIRHETNLGFSSSVNDGLKSTLKEDFGLVAIFNNDIIVSDEWFQNMFIPFVMDPRIGMVTGTLYTDRQEFEEAALRVPLLRKEKKPMEHFEAWLKDGPWLFRTEVFRDIGLFDERFNPASYEDDDIRVRMAINGWVFGKTSESVAFHYAGLTRKGALSERTKVNYHDINQKAFMRKWGIETEEGNERWGVLYNEIFRSREFKYMLQPNELPGDENTIHRILYDAKDIRSSTSTNMISYREYDSLPGDERIVDIIVPCLNHLETTLECLEAIKKNTSELENVYRVTVINDGSDDETPVVLSANPIGFKHYKYIENETNTGFSSVTNQGWNSALEDGYSLVAIFNNDNLVGEGWLPPLLEALQTFKKVGMVTGFLHPNKESMDSDPVDKGKLQFVPWMKGGPWLFRVRVFTEIGGFDEDFNPAWFEDDDFLTRMALNGIMFGLVRNSIGIHYDGVTRKGELKKRMGESFYQDNFYRYCHKWGVDDDDRFLPVYEEMYHKRKVVYAKLGEVIVGKNKIEVTPDKLHYGIELPT